MTDEQILAAYGSGPDAEGADYAHRQIGTEVALFQLMRQHILGLCHHLLQMRWTAV